MRNPSRFSETNAPEGDPASLWQVLAHPLDATQDGGMANVF
jgi:hypothetical protein